MQRACGTSLEAAILVANKIALGQIEVGIAGGVDTISDPPVVYPRSYQRCCCESFRGRTLRAAHQALARPAPADLKPVMPAVVEPRTGLSMGQSWS